MHTVVLVLAPEDSVELLSVGERMHVWAVDSPGHRSAAERIWAASPARLEDRSLTLFCCLPGEEPETICCRVLSDIDLHHGEYSGSQSYRAVEVLGCPMSDRLRSRFEEFGFTRFFPSAGGFRAGRPIEA